MLSSDQKTRTNVATVKANEINPMIVDAREIGAKALFLLMETPMARACLNECLR